MQRTPATDIVCRWVESAFSLSRETPRRRNEYQGVEKNQSIGEFNAPVSSLRSHSATLACLYRAAHTLASPSLCDVQTFELSARVVSTVPASVFSSLAFL